MHPSFFRPDEPGDQGIISIQTRVNGDVKLYSIGEKGVLGSGAITLRLNAGDRVWNTMQAGPVVEGATEMTLVRISP